MPNFTSSIELKQHKGPIPKSILPTDPIQREATLRQMIMNSPNNYVVVEENTLPRVEIKITFEEGKHGTAANLASALTVLLQKMSMLSL